MHIFISRAPADWPLLCETLASRGLKVTGQSFIRLNPLKPEQIPAADWIFFSSGNGVRFFFESLKNNQLEIPASVKWAAIGPATAAALPDFTGRIDFAGNGDPEKTAELFKAVAARQKVLFPGARHAREDLRRRVAAFAEVETLAVYDNQPVENPPFVEAELLIFTSPMNAEAYFAVHKPISGQKFMAIGQSTAAALHQLGATPVLIPDSPSETAVLDLVLAQISG